MVFSNTVDILLEDPAIPTESHAWIITEFRTLSARCPLIGSSQEQGTGGIPATLTAMADFRQLALQFVLEDQEEKQTLIAKQAATGARETQQICVKALSTDSFHLEIQTAQANTNPVARWVESVQPWMPGNNEEDVVEGQDTPDWTSRAKGDE